MAEPRKAWPSTPLSVRSLSRPSWLLPPKRPVCRPYCVGGMSSHANSVTSRSVIFTSGPLLLRLGCPVRVVLDAERLHLGQLLAPGGLLLVPAPAVGDLLPLHGGCVERFLGGLALSQRLGDLERELALILVGGGHDRVRHQQWEARLDGVQVLVGVGEGLAEDRRAQVGHSPGVHDGQIGRASCRGGSGG